MRVVYVDLQSNTFFMRAMYMLIKGQRAIEKHRYILNWLINNDVEVVNFVTKDGSSLPSGFLKKITRFRFFRKMEAMYVFKKNGINKKKIKIITDVKELREDDVIVFYGHFYHTQWGFDKNALGVKVVDHIHFYGDSKMAELVKSIEPNYYMCEVDLQKYCPLFQKNYGWFNGGYVRNPFAYQPRFKVIKEFKDRKNRAVAMGTLTKCDMPEFVECYNTEYYQPHRKMIFDNVQRLEPLLDSYITEYQEDNIKKINPEDNFIVKFRKRYHNFFNSGMQKKYFSFDMVEKYNEYKMFICPEDAVGSYGIGTIEGMACGCAMIGWNYGAFEDLGMEAGKHYIAYDGTIEDLEAKISYYQMDEHQEELEKIAKNGCEFVRERFSQKRVAREYYENLLEISKKGK